MEQKGTLYNLLEDVINDNPTYNFPIDTIRLELNQMLTNQEEFDYFFRQAHTKIKSNHPQVFLYIFINTCEMVLEISKETFHNMTEEEYQLRVDILIDTLEKLKITRVEKSSPDGEMMSIMG
jgi:hypothetical protein